MRARSREINIFSLSLMDVISGAMGAFLIIMIILARYYVFDPEVTQNVDELKLRLDAAVEGLNRIRGGTEQIFSELIESETGARTEGLQAGETLDQIEALSRGIRADVDRVNNQLAAAHSDVNRLEEELQEKSAQLKRAEERIDDLDRRNPLVVGMNWACDPDINLFLESDRSSKQTGKPGVSFDPRIVRSQNFTGDNGVNSYGGPGADVQIVGEALPRTNYKVFVYLKRPVPPGADCWIQTFAFDTRSYFQNLAGATLTTAASYDYLGRISVKDDGTFSYAEPSAAEREAELDAVRTRLASTPDPATENKNE